MTAKAQKFDYKPKESEDKESGIKTVYIGTRKLRDMETGEVVELEYFDKKISRKLKGGWRRVYLESFMEVLTGLYSSAKKIDIVDFILENLNSENQLTLTQQQVIEKTQASPNTVVDTYKHLVKMGFMKKQGSVFVVNPKFVCAFGSDKKNCTIAIKYEAEDPTLF